MLREELSFIQHVRQDLSKTIFIDKSKQPSMTNMIPAQVLRRNVSLGILNCRTLKFGLQPTRHVTIGSAGAIPICRDSIGSVGWRLGRSGGGSCRSDDACGQSLAFLEEPFEATFESGELFESFGFEDHDGEKGDESDEGFDGESFLPWATPIDSVVVESIILVPERDSVAGLRVKRQSIGDEQKVFKEL